MLIRLASDIHLEFGLDDYDYILPPMGEDSESVLVVSGDIHTGDSATEEFLPYMGSRFEHVFYVLGNHEFYGYDFDRVAIQVREGISDLPNVTLLDDDAVEHNGVRFLGATLWTSVNNRDPLSMMLVRDSMNDYRAIRKNVRKLTVEDTVDKHEESVEFIKNALAAPFNGPTVVATHHGPSHQSAHHMYRGNRSERLNVAYYSDLEYIMHENDIAYWFHGHTHSTMSYEINGCKVRMNPRGYGYVSENPDYDPFFRVEV